MENFWELQSGFNVLFQSLGAWLEFPMRLFTFMGEEQFFMLVMPAIYWCLDAGLGLRLGIILLSSNSLNHYLKVAFHTPRPYWINPGVKAHVLESSFGLPSGHSQNSASLWGRLAAATSQRWLRAGLVILVILIGLSRLYLGVHSIADVLLGWAIGALLVWMSLKLETPVTQWVKRQEAPALLGFSLLVSLGVILVDRLILGVFGAWAIPEEWIKNAILAGATGAPDPFSSSGIISGAGTLFGFLAGAIWLRGRGGYCAAGRGWKLAARYALGVTGVFVIWFGLDQLFPDGTHLLANSLRYLRYALAGVWISGVAPDLFIRLGWARRSEARLEVQPELAS